MISILAPDSILEVDSLEADLILDEQSLEDSIQAIPEPIWPEKSDQVPPNSIKVDKDINYVADISFKKDDNSNDVIGKGNKNVLSNHQIALRSIFINLVKWQQDFYKSRQMATRFSKNLVKWQRDL